MGRVNIFLRVEADTAGEGKGLPCGLRRGPFHLGQQIGGCARRVGWPVGVARVTEVCLKELCEIGLRAACGFLLGARWGGARSGCPQQTMCHTGNVRFCMSRGLAPRRQCLLQRLCVCRFCRDSVRAEELSKTSLGSTPLWSGCKIKEERARGGSVPAPLGLEIPGPAPSFGLTAFQARCWDCGRSARCAGGGRQLETPSVSAGCSDGAGVAASEWRPEAKPLLPG